MPKEPGRPTSPLADLASDEWQRLCARHPGNPCLDFDPLYSLTGPMIDWLEKERKPILGPDQLQFEKDLAELTGGGIFSRKMVVADPLGLSTAGSPGNALGHADEQGRHEEAEERPPVANPLLDPYPTPGGVEVEALQDNDESFLRTQRAYSVWLMCNKKFISERDELRKLFSDHVEQLGFPLLQGAARMSDGLGGRTPPDEAFHAFYLRWGLSTLLTWDLPLPSRPTVPSNSDQITVNHPGAGVTVFIPFHFFQSPHLPLADIAIEVEKADNLRHLADWLTPPKQESHLGQIRLQYQFLIYRYWRLVLSGRYCSQVRGKTELLDHIFAWVLNVKSETVRKVRLDLWQRLG